MGDLFERDAEAVGGHRSSDPGEFYEQCMEMAMVRIARVRRALRGRSYELVFGYTSALDLVGHVAHPAPEMQERAYEELADFVGELRGDLDDGDEQLLVSDHGLQDGVHTEETMVVATTSMVEDAKSVLDVRKAVERTLDQGHVPEPYAWTNDGSRGRAEAVESHLEDLGYL